MKTRIVCFGLLLTAASLIAAPVIGAQQPGGVSPGADSSAMDTLKRMGDFMSRLQRFSVTIRDGYDVVQESGQKIEFGDVRKLTLVRPDRLRVDVLRSDGEKAHVAFDGRLITVYSPNQKVYATSYVPGDIDGAVTHFVRDLQMHLPLAMLLLTGLPGEIDRRVVSAEVVETSSIIDPPCIHLAARTDRVDFQVWVPSEGDPLPRRVVITYKEEAGQPQFWANFTEWNLSPEAADTLFALSIPQEATRIEFLSRMRPAAKPAAKKGGRK